MTLLDLTFPTPAENLACDEALLDLAERGATGEVLRFWESPVHFVALGYANHAAAEVHLTGCESLGIPVLRRCSGGGTVLQGPGCLNYALILKIDETGPTRGIGETNRLVMDRHARVMEKITGRPVAVRGHTDLAIAGMKFSGNAQRRRRRFLLFHGTLLLRLDLALVARVLALPSQRPAYRGDRAHGDFMLNTGLDAGAVRHALRSAWDAFEDVPIFPGEAVRELVRVRYSRPEWNLKF